MIYMCVKENSHNRKSKISEQHLLPSKLKSGENYLFEARKDENSVIHLIQLFYDHILNKKNYCHVSRTKSCSASTYNTFHSV